MSMYDNDIDWSSLLSPNSMMPPDITLKLIPVGGGEEGAVVEKAHRYVLSLLSPVLKIHLSEGGVWEGTGSDVTLNDVSPKPFRIMLDFFYIKGFELSHELSMQDLFEIMKVADRFEVIKLVQLCKRALEKFPTDLTSLVENVNTAKAYIALAPILFEEVSDEIIERSCDFFRNRVDVIKRSATPDVLYSVAQSDAEKLKRIVDNVEATIKIIEDEIRKECSTCGEMMFKNKKSTHDNMDCKVIFKNMVAGARIMVTERSRYKYDVEDELEAGHQGDVMSGNVETYGIRWDDPAGEHVNGEEYFSLRYDISKDLHVPMKYIRG